jgi:hypothetical protein
MGRRVQKSCSIEHHNRKLVLRLSARVGVISGVAHDSTKRQALSNFRLGSPLATRPAQGTASIRPLAVDVRQPMRAGSSYRQCANVEFSFSLLRVWNRPRWTYNPRPSTPVIRLPSRAKSLSDSTKRRFRASVVLIAVITYRPTFTLPLVGLINVALCYWTAFWGLTGESESPHWPYLRSRRVGAHPQRHRKL